MSNLFFPFLVFAVISAAAAPFWILPLWVKLSPSKQHHRDEIARNDAVLLALTAHFIERPDLWVCDGFCCECAKLTARIWIANGREYVDFRTKDASASSGRLSMSARGVFWKAYSERRAKVELDKVRKAMSGIEESINERRENVVPMRAGNRP